MTQLKFLNKSNLNIELQNLMLIQIRWKKVENAPKNL
jgi:hypothetical protein